MRRFKLRSKRQGGRIILSALVATLGLLAGACGSDGGSGGAATTTASPSTTATPTTTASPSTTDAPATTEPPAEFRVAIVAPSASNDLAFTQSIVDGVAALSGVTEVHVTDGTFIVDEAAAAVRAYAEDGYDLVIAHGSQYGGALELIAPDFPDTAFAWGTSGNTFGLANVSAYTAASDEGGYVMGAMAAALSESGVVGVVGPIEVGDAKLYVDGFVAGAAAQDAGVEVNVNYIQSFSDVALAAEAAQGHVANGADVLTGTAQMVVGATGVAAEHGAKWFGTQANQTPLGADIVVASQVYKWEVVLQGVIDGIKAGDLGGEAHEINLANGGLVIEFNDAIDIGDVKAVGEAAIAGLGDGTLTTAGPPAEFRVAIVAPSASNDLAFTQSIVDGVAALSGVTEVHVTDGTFIVDEAAAAVRAYAEDGYDLVIAHGSQYGGALELIAPDFPDTAFAWGTSGNTFGLANVSAYTAASDEGGYVMGAMAAALSESGVVGVVGPIEVGDAKLYVDGFVAGAAAQDAGVEVNVNYIQSFSDVALAAEAAQGHVANGADVLTGTAQMVVGATGVAAEHGAKWFGTQANQTPLGADIVVASQVYKWEVVLQGVIDGIKAGDLGGEAHEINLANGGLVIEFNDAIDIGDVKAVGEAAIAGLGDGTLTTGS
ncbi:MAG: BMP family ABC transporter substrate-binding protein [Actinobacteria bacterium]|nr:BMP family ABC transporter substrate-binding protein [Actinomycetota bacterium]